MLDEFLKPTYSKVKDLEFHTHKAKSRIKQRGKEIFYDAKGARQVIVKVSSYSKSESRLSSHLGYISRNNQLDLEKDNGDLLSSKDDVEAAVEAWMAESSKKKGARVSANLVFSAPKGSDRQVVKDGLSTFLEERFGGKNEYLFVMHDDTDHPHGHVVVKTRGYDGKQLRINRDELYELRVGFAEKLRARGLNVSATYRSDRGVGQRSDTQKVHQMRGKGVVLDVDKAVMKQAIRQRINGKVEEPWHVAMRKKNEQTKQAIVELAAEAESNAKFKVISAILFEHVARLSNPKTRADALNERADIQKAVQQKGKDHDLEK